MLKLALGGMIFVAGAVTMLVILTNDMSDEVFDAWLTQDDPK